MRVAALVGLITLACASEASAQGSSAENTAAAQILYDQGMTALDARDHARACPKFEEASKLVPEAVGVKLMLAQCYEESGRLASAWTTYRVAESEAARLKQEERRIKAQRRVEALEGRVARLTLDVPPEVASTPGLQVKRGAVDVSPALYGTPIPVDAGEVAITAAAGQRSFDRRVTVKDGEQLVVTIELRGPSPTPDAPERLDAAPGRALDEMAIGAIVAGSAGVALLGAGIALGVKAIGDQSDADAICPQEACSSQAAVDLSDQANAFSIAAWVAIGTGTAAIGAGAALLALSFGKSSTDEGATPELVIRPGGLSYRLRF